jgi:GntR family transcriptional regulator
MDLEVDADSSIPLYIQIVDQIKDFIAVGKFKPGQQLPTVRQLASDLRVNFNTVARAYFLLDQEGIISTQRGRGTFVTGQLNHDQLSRMRQEKLKAIISTTVIEALRLGYSPEEIRQIFDEHWEQ